MTMGDPTADIGELKNAINDEWCRIYGGVRVEDVKALVSRVKQLAADRDSWAFNARVLQKEANGRAK